VADNGQINFLSHKVVINSEFIQIAGLGRKPEKRFRFANTCIENKCSQWENGQCGLIRKLVNAFHDNEESEQVFTNSISNCSIRYDCRWYGQYGFDACKICPEIVTDLTGSGSEYDDLSS
jgi:hypothetical protein